MNPHTGESGVLANGASTTKIRADAATTMAAKLRCPRVAGTSVAGIPSRSAIIVGIRVAACWRRPSECGAARGLPPSGMPRVEGVEIPAPVLFLGPLEGNQVVPGGVHDESGNIADVELRHEAGAMRLDRLHAHLEDAGDLLGALAFGDQLQDLALPARE